MDDTGVDPAGLGAEAQVDVGGRDERVAGGEKADVRRLGGGENRRRVALDLGAAAHLHLDVVGGGEFVDGRPDQVARVELRERPVGSAEGVASGERDRSLVVQPQSDEGEHTTPPPARR
ncbi:MAG: hypothetical protein A07HB70_00010 [uncultured archaeon A07HB70]|nr:MAG: hypothetical protein A07HB70_00010 [uncultured archaeon A07HB70]